MVREVRAKLQRAGFGQAKCLTATTAFTETEPREDAEDGELDSRIHLNISCVTV
jgi:hypothetical protein